MISVEVRVKSLLKSLMNSSKIIDRRGEALEAFNRNDLTDKQLQIVIDDFETCFEVLKSLGEGGAVLRYVKQQYCTAVMMQEGRRRA